MFINNNCKALALLLACFVYSSLFAQTRYEGDMLINAIGKTDQSTEVGDLKSSYSFQMANENHYLSQDGIELVLQNSTLNEIRIYMNSTVYGSFKGKLPKGLRFGLTSAEVKRQLGKPSASYASGYCEFELQNSIISCWFDKDHLSQIDLGAK
jgi:hypothetical protein